MDMDGPPPFGLLSNPTLVVYLYQYGLGLIFLLGFTGNLASFLTFRRPVLRSTSTGWLFLVLSVSDTAFLLLEVFDFVEVGIVQAPIFLAYYNQLCRFRAFLKGLFQLQSAWILALVAIDRWLRARFPFKASRWCTRRNTSIAMLMILVMGCSLHSHLLIPSFFGSLSPGIANEACGPKNPTSSYVAFYFRRWPIVQVVLAGLIPVTFMLISSVDIYHIIRKEKMRVQPQLFTAGDQRKQRQERLQTQMLLLGISSIVIFVVTTLPTHLRRIYAVYEVEVLGVTSLYDIDTHMGILTIVVSLNYAVNFYVHCLASRLFRKEFLRCIAFVVHNRPVAGLSTQQQFALVQHRAN